MDKCRPFDEVDMEEVNGWYCSRGMRPLSYHMFPDVGYIVPGIGAGFLYQTDSSLCFIDGYISSPVSTREERREAFDLITNAIIRTAKDHGFQQILAYTRNHGVKERCERFHFQLRGQYDLYVKEI